MGLARAHAHTLALVHRLHTHTHVCRMRAGGHVHSSMREERATMQCNVAFFSSSSFLGPSLLLLLLLTAARILMCHRRGRRQCPLWECSPALLDEYHVCSISAAVVSVVHRLHIGTRCSAVETAVLRLSPPPPKSTLLCCCTRCWKPPFSTLVSPSISVLF